jgi:hypothetical protein
MVICYSGFLFENNMMQDDNVQSDLLLQGRCAREIA